MVRSHLNHRNFEFYFINAVKNAFSGTARTLFEAII
jgi:hypothetical protein